MKILQVNGLTKQFDGLKAVDDLDLELGEREILGLIGPNGAGKTTVFNLLTGFIRPNGGTVIFDGTNITTMKPNKVAALGLVRTFQLVNLVADHTVYENVLTAHYLQRNSSLISSIIRTNNARKNDRHLQEQTIELLERMGLLEIKDETAASLPHGIQKTLGICMALAAMPKVLLLDEPTAGMSAAETADMMEQIQNMRRSGISIILVAHDLKMVMGVCDRVAVLNFGLKIAEGTPKEIAKNEQVISAYLGYSER